MAGATKKKYHQGHDIKSLLLNLATTILFVLPIAVYLDRENTQNYCIATGASLLVAFLAPPFGPYRPHVYSDWEGNKPLQFRQ